MTELAGERRPVVGPAAADFRSEPALELRRASVRASLEDALAETSSALPRAVAILAGELHREGAEIVSANPCRPEQAVAHAPVASDAEVHEAVGCAAAAAPGWAAAGAGERARTLLASARWLRERREQLAALVLLECAKPWPEADADVCEAIDFLEYYARAAVALEAPRQLVSPPGERNVMHYRPRGVVAVIAPWNFPLAIPTGMVAAGLASGNSVVLKPAEQSPGCAAALAEALAAGGVPPAGFSLLPGAGETGAALVREAGVQTIAFTGSLAVGREIIAAAAEGGAPHIKRVVSEMGGKNCVIVDGDADLDEVVPALVASAFAYAGQKCSAASRVLAHERIAEQLLARLAGAVELLRVGDAADFETVVPAVIEQSAQRRVDEYRELARRDGVIVAERAPVPTSGWYSAPTLAARLDPASPVLGEEIFGPLLAFESVRDVAEACDRVDALPYALTGGLFTRDPETVAYVTRRSPVGNLYVNRAITGAKVARQPFGGNRLSGSGAKAGGPDYLLQFVEPQVLSENTVRHGLVV